MKNHERSKQQKENFNPWNPGGRGRPPYGKENAHKKPIKDRHKQVIKQDVRNICKCIIDLSGYAGIERKRMAEIVNAGILGVLIDCPVPGIYAILKAIKRIKDGMK